MTNTPLFDRISTFLEVQIFMELNIHGTDDSQNPNTLQYVNIS